jgi:hypothetical protein
MYRRPPRKGNEENSIRLYAHVINTTPYRQLRQQRVTASLPRIGESMRLRQSDAPRGTVCKRPLRSSMHRLRTQRHLRRPKCRVFQIAPDLRATLCTSSGLSTKIVHRPVDNLCVFLQALAAKGTFCVAHAQTNERRSGWRRAQRPLRGEAKSIEGNVNALHEQAARMYPAHAGPERRSGAAALEGRPPHASTQYRRSIYR